MRRPVVGPDAGDPAIGDDDRRRFDPLGKDVDDPPAGQEQVGRLVAAGDADAPLEEVQVAPAGVRPVDGWGWGRGSWVSRLRSLGSSPCPCVTREAP